MFVRMKRAVVEAITFDELVAHGREHAESMVDGVPWSFQYQGHPITHENDDCYLVPTLAGHLRFERGDMLITGERGNLIPCHTTAFEEMYERVPADV